MKRVLFILSVLFAVVAMSSCAGSQKHCAAYAKHNASDAPTYHDVQ